MKILFYTFCLSFISLTTMRAQSEKPEILPFKEIPTAPEAYTENAILARMIEGLGYRYYWATEGLTQEDLDYTPGNYGMKCSAVLDHLKGLSETISNAFSATPNIRPRPQEDLTWEETRRQTLLNLKAATDLLRSTKSTPEEYNMIFQRGEKSSEFPLWNLLNGPLADAIYHVGQVVSYRRSAGNPINPNVNVFIGKTKE